MVFKKIVKYLCCFIVWIRDFIKKLRSLKSKISTKFHRLLFLFYFLAFLAFCLLFHVPKLVQKLCNFLWCFIGRVRDFTNDFWKILEVLLKKYIEMWNEFFFKILHFTFFLIFLLFLTFYFQFRLSVLVKKMLEIFVFFFILWIRDFIKELWKIMECFSIKYGHLKSKILHKFQRLLFVFFILLAFC